jgi:alpha-mannosidase
MDELRRDDLAPLPKIVPSSGRFADVTSVAIERPLFGGDASLRYTLDGSVPTPESREYESPLRLYQPALLKAQLFAGNAAVGAAAEAHLDVQDVTPPALTGAVAVMSIPCAVVGFSEAVDPVSAQNASHYAISGGVKVRSAVLAADGASVTLELAAPPAAGAHRVTVRGVADRSPSANAVKGVREELALLRPLVKEASQLEGSGAGVKEIPLGADAPTRAAAPWSINVWLWIDAQPEDYTLLAGFGNARDRSGVQRYLAKFPEGLHFWGSSVDIPTHVPLDLGRWQMLTATFDGVLVRVFKDGQELASQNVTLGDAAAVAKLGPPAPWSWGHQLAGKLAAFTLWDRALPPMLVDALYRQGHR